MRTKAILLAGLALVALSLSLAPGASAAPDEPNCMPVYNEYPLGPITIVQYSSCSYDVKFNGADPCGWDPQLC